jgi:uncharacterized protein
VHVPPVLRGGVGLRTAVLVAGLAFCALSIVAMKEAALGLPPWDVLQQGISERTPLSFGLANVAVGVVVLVLSWKLGARIGPGTVANAVLVGLFVDLLSSVEWVERLDQAALPARIGLIVFAMISFGVGSGLYIGAAMGAGPRDSLMLVLARRTGNRISIVRAGIEIAVCVLGLALGGALGVGTAVFALTIGPAVELGFGLLLVLRLASPGGVLPVAAATIDAR